MKVMRAMMVVLVTSTFLLGCATEDEIDGVDLTVPPADEPAPPVSDTERLGPTIIRPPDLVSEQKAAGAEEVSSGSPGQDEPEPELVAAFASQFLKCIGTMGACVGTAGGAYNYCMDLRAGGWTPRKKQDCGYYASIAAGTCAIAMGECVAIAEIRTDGSQGRRRLVVNPNVVAARRYASGLNTKATKVQSDPTDAELAQLYQGFKGANSFLGRIMNGSNPVVDATITAKIREGFAKIQDAKPPARRR